VDEKQIKIARETGRDGEAAWTREREREREREKERERKRERP
jgi:hypothetical protein